MRSCFFYELFSRKVLLFYETFASTLEMHKLEDSEIERYMRETNACDEFYPLQYYKLSKALDLTPKILKFVNRTHRFRLVVRHQKAAKAENVH
ncbi:Homeobox-leucine zipper protein [Trichinella spiralis]|uniref:Homeobox-leucine zipper protein n=1 Tax=Trichinella spiralis TaxID=6334 RepID=A0ABR3KC36_TRISP